MGRDISKKQFDEACKRHGFTTHGFLGYYNIGYGTEVSILNAGIRKRDQLAYLIQQKDKAKKRNKLSDHT